jgi:hypothetical protein
MPLPKSPYPPRKGPERWADWFRQCVVTKRLQDRYTNGGIPEVLILTPVTYEGAENEGDVYVRTLTELGVKNINLVREGRETINQLQIAAKRAKDSGRRLIVVCTWLHYPRVAWLIMFTGAAWCVPVFGIPNLKYSIVDVLVMFPLTIVLSFIPGGLEWFSLWTWKRRQAGKY